MRPLKQASMGGAIENQNLSQQCHTVTHVTYRLPHRHQLRRVQQQIRHSPNQSWEYVSEWEVQENQSLDRLRDYMDKYTREDLNVEAYTVEFMRLCEEVPELVRDGEEVASRYVKGLGPEFEELMAVKSDSVAYLAGRAKQIESKLRRNDIPLQPYYYTKPEEPTATFPRVGNSGPARHYNPYFVPRGGKDKGKLKFRGGRGKGPMIREAFPSSRSSSGNV